MADGSGAPSKARTPGLHAPARDREVPASRVDNAPTQVKALANIINGCKDNLDGMNAKVSLVFSYVASSGDNLLTVLCWLHDEKAIFLDSGELLKIITWQKPKSASVADMNEPSNPGMFVASTLAACAVGDMKAVVDKFVHLNGHLDAIPMLRQSAGLYISRGVSTHIVACDELEKPLPGGIEPPAWTKLWEGDIPIGSPTYVDVRNPRGQRARIAFLGSVDDTGANPTLKTPANIFADQWGLPIPSLCICADAGSMHPQQADSINMMCNLPQFREWMGVSRPRGNIENVVPDDQQGSHAATPHARDGARSPTADHRTGKQLRYASDAVQTKAVSHGDLASKTIEAWQRDLDPMDTDKVMADGSINRLILSKLKEVFGALLDAATLAGSWIVVDRTDGRGSASAELLLELALERGAQRPVIVAIDSLERLGRAREGTTSHAMLTKLNKLFRDDEGASQMPNGTEKELQMDFMYKTDDFSNPAVFADTPDSKLPFEVIDDHKRKTHGGTCDPNRKWRYFYVDGLYSNATHYIIKNNDHDEFDIEGMARMGFLYAHGDTRTFKRLRANIQQGKPIVMLHNSGGVVTAFSWLQRVMAFTRPAPPTDKLRGPLKFLIANLSKANWVHDFGVPEILMMKGLADRAPQLFRKHVVSVDILTDSEEQMLEMITGCFAAAGGVPELGLGNAEVNVVFNAWNLHLTLCENARRFWRFSVVAQVIIWTLALITTVISISVPSLTTEGAVLERYVNMPDDAAGLLVEILEYAAILFPIVIALVTTMTSKMLWRDKWSVCIMAASQLVAEIYKFRMMTLEYEWSASSSLSNGDDRVPLTAKQKTHLARQTFVERVQAFYSTCLTEMAQGGALKRKRAKVSATQRQDYRTNQESRPTLAQWFNIKRHVESHYYNTSWTPPSNAFLTWVSGLRPYLQQRSLREEVKGVLEVLIARGRILLKRKPLTRKQSTQIRHGLAQKLGLSKKALEAQKDEIRQLQREVVTELINEQVEESALADNEEHVTPSSFESEATTDLASYHESKDRDSGDGSTAGGAVARAITGSAAVAPGLGVEASITDPAETMRKSMMELQGRKYGQLSAAERREEAKTKKRSDSIAKQVEDDYLFGPMSVDSYVIFRVRPLIEKYEKRSAELSNLLTLLDVVGFAVNSLGAVLAVDFVNFSEWVALSVAIAAVLTGVIEFTQLRNQVVSVNLALGDLQNMIVWWDSLSVVRRRTDATKRHIVGVTEAAVLHVVKEFTTAASNTQTSVAKHMANEAGDDDGDS